MSPDASDQQPASAAETPGPRLCRWSLFGALLRGAVVGLLAVLAWELILLLLLGNVRVVIPGEVYRCSQPTPDMVKSLVSKYGIRTIVNLRGYCEGAEWYEAEHRAGAALGVSVEDLSFSANRLPSTTEMQHLLEVLDRSERPILLHCYRGVDRTGLASVMALLLYTDTPLEEALWQLSLRYLHLPFGRTGNLDRFFDRYADWLQEREISHSASNLRTWLRDGYTAGPCSCRLELIGNAVTGPADPKRTAPHIGRSEPPNGLPVASDSLRARQCITVPCGRPFALRVRCHNTSTETWAFDPNLNTGIHGVWQVRHGADIIGRGRVGAFHADVPPGSFIDLWVALPSLGPSTSYRLQFGLMEENHGNFYEQGAEPLDLELEAP